MRVFDFNSALVRSPGKSVVDGLRTGGTPPVFEKFAAEHAAYVAALRRCGLEVTLLEPMEDFPDSTFVEDPALVFSDAAVLLRPGASSRLGEAARLAPALSARFPRMLQLDQGHADGGDILVTPTCIYIGLSARTNESGAAGLRILLESLGRKSRVVHTPAATLHLKSDCSLVDEETMLVTADLARAGLFGGMKLLELPAAERAAANAVRVNDVMLVGQGFPRTADLLSAQGLEVVTLPVAEISKIDAGLSCMSLRWFQRTG